MRNRNNLDYLNNNPEYVHYKVSVGPGENLHPVNLRDIVFDDYDYKIRRLEKPTDKTALECLQEALGSSVVSLNHSEVPR